MAMYVGRIMTGLQPVLLVEDNENDTYLALHNLAEMRLENPIDTVRDGAEALDYLLRRGDYAERRSGDPILVLLDLKLPKLDGLDVLRAIRQTSHLRHLPVVILTASNLERDWAMSHALGIVAYLVKPIQVDSLHDAVAELGLAWGLLMPGERHD